MSFYPNQPPPSYMGYLPYAAQPFNQPFPPPLAIPVPYALPAPLPAYAVPPPLPHHPSQVSPVTSYPQPPSEGQSASVQGYSQQPPPPPAAVVGGGVVQSMTSGVQVDQYGIPLVPGDVTLRYVETFEVKERAMPTSRDSFVITDSSENVRYKVSGSWRMSELKELTDIHGQLLLRMREARLRLRDRLTIYSPSNVPLMTLQKTSMMQRKEKTVHGYLGGAVGEKPDLVIKGNDDGNHFSVKNALGVELGVVKKKRWNVKHMLTGQETYEVTVMTGAPSFMCFLAVALDEIYED